MKKMLETYQNDKYFVAIEIKSNCYSIDYYEFSIGDVIPFSTSSFEIFDKKLQELGFDFKKMLEMN